MQSVIDIASFAVAAHRTLLYAHGEEQTWDVRHARFAERLREIPEHFGAAHTTLRLPS
jgi:hypothetical protein